MMLEVFRCHVIILSAIAIFLSHIHTHTLTHTHTLSPSPPLSLSLSLSLSHTNTHPIFFFSPFPLAASLPTSKNCANDH